MFMNLFQGKQNACQWCIKGSRKSCARSACNQVFFSILNRLNILDTLTDSRPNWMECLPPKDNPAPIEIIPPITFRMIMLSQFTRIFPSKIPSTWGIPLPLIMGSFFTMVPTRYPPSNRKANHIHMSFISCCIHPIATFRNSSAFSNATR